MITQLQIHNYESHKKTVLDFPPGLTVFVGESDRGKSGVFRAFNWCRTNRPLGEIMLPLYWKGKTEVTVVFDDGQTVSRIKSKSVNEYQVNSDPPINAGTEAPQSVREIFQMESVNYQSQIDRSFLMFETPSERGRILNKLAGLDKIDSTSSNAKTDVRRIKAAKKVQEAAIESYTDDLAKYESLPKIEGLLLQASILERQIRQKEGTVSDVKKARETRQEIQQQLDKIGNLSGLELLIESAKTALVKYRELGNRIDQVEQAFQYQASLKKRKIPADKLSRIAELISQASSSLSRYKEGNKRVLDLSNLLNDKEDLEDGLKKKENEIVMVQKLIPKQCPTCGSVLTKEKPNDY